MQILNSSRALIFSKLAASFFSLIFIALLSRYVPGSDVGAIFECLFISQSLLFISDQGITPTLVIRQSMSDEPESRYARTSHFLYMRVKRTPFVLPLLVALLVLFTEVSLLSIGAVCISHVVTMMYSTINAGLLGANLRYVETISEPTSRLFALLAGTFFILGLQGFESAQSVLLIYAAADIFMLCSIVFLYRRTNSGMNHGTKIESKIDSRYRLTSTLNAGAMNTIGVGESWALSARSTSLDFAFYGIVNRFVEIAGLVASYAGYSHLPNLIKNLKNDEWDSIAIRCWRLVILSLIPTGLLTVVILWIRHNQIDIFGYDFQKESLPLVLFILSTPAIVLAKYLMWLLHSMHPGASTKIVLVVGTSNTIGALTIYPFYGLAGTFVVIAAMNYARAILLLHAARRIPLFTDSLLSEE
jgi:O-antigen/teichoic acid export membrane protein